MTQAVFQLEPFPCPSCIKKIETALSKTVGVESAKVLFNSGKVKVQFNENQVGAEQVEKTISSLGYSVLSPQNS